MLSRLKARIFFYSVALSCITNAKPLHLHVEAQGYNFYEAKLTARLEGMKRAMMLITDQLSLNKFDSSLIPYNILKDIFKLQTASEHYNNGRYQAEINYNYDQALLNSYLLKYGNEEIKQQFYEYLVIPIIKRYNQVIVWQPGILWLDLWKQSASKLDQYKLLYPAESLTKLNNIITEDPLSAANYPKILQHLPAKLFKKIILVYCEDSNVKTSTKSEYLKISYLTSSNTERKEKTKIINIAPREYNKNLPIVMQEVIDSFIKEYGRQQEAQVNNEHSNMRILKFQADASNANILARIKKKLSNLSDLATLKFSHNNKHLDITMHTTSDDATIAEALYVNGLTYKMKDNGLYLLIEFTPGT